MRSHITLIRAVGSEFVLRKLKGFAVIGAVLFLISIMISLYLTTIHIWWWLLAVPVIMTMIFGTISLWVAFAVVQVLRPRMTSIQKGAVVTFVDKLERVADHAQTPMFLIVFRVLRDVIRPRSKTFIELAVEDSASLHTDVRKLENLFREG